MPAQPPSSECWGGTGSGSAGDESRTARVSGETRWSVEPLAVEPGPDSSEPAAARTLFLDRAHSTMPGCSFDAENVAAIEAISAAWTVSRWPSRWLPPNSGAVAGRNPSWPRRPVPAAAHGRPRDDRTAAHDSCPAGLELPTARQRRTSGLAPVVGVPRWFHSRCSDGGDHQRSVVRQSSRPARPGLVAGGEVTVDR